MTNDAWAFPRLLGGKGHEANASSSMFGGESPAPRTPPAIPTPHSSVTA